MTSERYEGIKFRVEFTSKEPPHDEKLVDLKAWCKKFHDLGLAPPYEGGSYGNLSCRMAAKSDAFIITGSRIGMKHELSDDCFVLVNSCDPEKELVSVSGSREPSSETILHCAIYHNRKDINAIFHGHSQKILKWAQKLNITETREEKPYGTVDLVESLLEVLGSENFLIIKNHGFISMGKSMEEAGNLALLMYNSCK